MTQAIVIQALEDARKSFVLALVVIVARNTTMRMALKSAKPQLRMRHIGLVVICTPAFAVLVCAMHTSAGIVTFSCALLAPLPLLSKLWLLCTCLSRIPLCGAS